MPILQPGRRQRRSHARKPIIIPVEGVDYSRPSDLIADRRSFAQNMFVMDDLFRKMYGYTKYGTVPAQSAILNMVVFELQSQAKRLIRATTSVLEKYNTSTGEWDYIPGHQLSVAETDPVGFALCSELDRLVVCQSTKGALQIYADGGSLADLGGSPPKAKTIDWFAPYLVAAHLEESGSLKPTKIRWTDTAAAAADLENWSSGNAGEKNLSYEPSGIQRLMRLNEEEIAYKQKSIYSGRQVATAQVIDWSILKTDIGLFSSRFVSGIAGRHWFGSQDDFYENNGITVTSIGRPVRSKVFGRMNTNRPELSWAMVVEQMKEVWFFVCVGSGSYATELWRYNYETGFWYGPDPIRNVTAGTNYVVVSSLTWDTMKGTWDSKTFPWDFRTGLSDSPIQIFGRSDGHTYKMDQNTFDDNGEIVDSWFESIDYMADELSSRKEWAELDVWAYGSNCDVSYSTDEGRTWTYVTTLELESTMPQDAKKVYFHVNASKIRFRLRVNSLGSNFVFKSLQPYYMVAEATE